MPEYIELHRRALRELHALPDSRRADFIRLERRRHARDDVVPVQGGRYLADHIPGARMLEVGGAAETVKFNREGIPDTLRGPGRSILDGSEIGPVIHIVTEKGKGYPPAEAAAQAYPGWARTPLKKRLAAIEKFRERVVAETEKLALVLPPARNPLRIELESAAAAGNSGACAPEHPSSQNHTEQYWRDACPTE